MSSSEQMPDDLKLRLAWAISVVSQDSEPDPIGIAAHVLLTHIENRDAEVERLVEALREAQDTIDRMADGPHRADWGNMLDKIDALLREYTPKEKQG